MFFARGTGLGAWGIAGTISQLATPDIILSLLIVELGLNPILIKSQKPMLYAIL